MKTTKLYGTLGLLLIALPILSGCGAHKETSTVSSTPQAPKAPPPGVAHNIAVMQGKGP